MVLFLLWCVLPQRLNRWARAVKAPVRFPLCAWLHTHTHTQIEDCETRTKQEKRLKENPSGTAAVQHVFRSDEGSVHGDMFSAALSNVTPSPHTWKVAHRGARAPLMLLPPNECHAACKPPRHESRHGLGPEQGCVGAPGRGAAIRCEGVRNDYVGVPVSIPDGFGRELMQYGTYCVVSRAGQAVTDAVHRTHSASQSRGPHTTPQHVSLENRCTRVQGM